MRQILHWIYQPASKSTARSMALAVFITLAVTACGGTQVVTAEKTVVYREAIYNVSGVQLFTRKTQGVISQDEVIDLAGTEKSAFNSLLEKHDGELFVRQVFMLDDQELVYQARSVDSWSDYNRMAKQFDNAAEDMTKFLADGKKTQLKLK